jgi:hypothetical protein
VWPVDCPGRREAVNCPHSKRFGRSEGWYGRYEHSKSGRTSDFLLRESLSICPLLKMLPTNNKLALMREIKELLSLYYRGIYATQGLAECSEWAVRRLEADDEGDDLDVVLLASSRDEGERKQLAETVLDRYLADGERSDETGAGKYIVALHASYVQGTASIADIDRWLTRVSPKLRYPDWLVMLSRNCEYATDVDAFVEPFENELQYVAQLWNQSQTIEEFNSRYDRAISNSHDFQ